MYYLVAEDFGPEGIGWYDDFTITTTPGDRACGTPSGWGNFFDTYVVTT